jgi:hypothetical protein
LGGFAAEGLGGHYGDYGLYGSCYWGTATHSFGPELAVSGERAFVLAQVGSGNWPRFGPLILDVADPAAVRQLGVIETLSDHPSAVVVSGNRAYIRENFFSGTGLAAVDITDPANPQSLSDGEVPMESRAAVSGVALQGHYAWGLNQYWDDTPGLVAYEVDDPAKPTHLGHAWAWEVFGDGTPSTGVELFRVTVSQNRIFVAAGTEGLAIFEMPPYLKSITKEGPNVKLKWEGFGPARLQRATRLTNPDWFDLPGYEGTNTATLPANNGGEFFRLVRP